MTSELERIKILEGKIGQVVDHIHKLTTENEKLKQQLKELNESLEEGENAQLRAEMAELHEHLDRIESLLGKRDG